MKKKLPVDPTAKDEALATYIFEQMIDNGKSLREISKALGQRPSAISRWLRDKHGQEYQNAQEERAEYWADELMREVNAIALEGNSCDNAKVQATRLKVETMKWIASKLKPRQYGDKVQHTGDDKQPLHITVVRYSDVVKEEENGLKRE